MKIVESKERESTTRKKFFISAFGPFYGDPLKVFSQESFSIRTGRATIHFCDSLLQKAYFGLLLSQL